MGPLTASLVLFVAAASPGLQHPAFTLKLIEGQRTDQGAPKEGMVKVVSEPANQMVYWGVANVTLQARAEHERQLVLRAAEGQGSVEPMQSRAGLGEAALAWSARIERTYFQSTVVACAGYHVVLTTMGPDPDDIRARHDGSLKTLKCKAGALRGRAPKKRAPKR